MLRSELLLIFTSALISEAVGQPRPYRVFAVDLSGNPIPDLRVTLKVGLIAF